MVTVQPARPEALQPAALDGNHRQTRSKKSLHVSRRGFTPGVESHARALPRQQIVVKARRLYGPYDGPRSIFRLPWLEPLDVRFFADVKQHGSPQTQPYLTI